MGMIESGIRLPLVNLAEDKQAEVEAALKAAEITLQ